MTDKTPKKPLIEGFDLPQGGRNIHANCLVLKSDDQTFGLLVSGDAGAGKTQLCFSLFERWNNVQTRSAKWVSDDRTVLELKPNGLNASPPEGLAGIAELRGLGPVGVKHCASIVLTHWVHLVPAEQIERVQPREQLAIASFDDAPLHFLKAPSGQAEWAARMIDYWLSGDLHQV